MYAPFPCTRMLVVKICVISRGLCYPSPHHLLFLNPRPPASMVCVAIYPVSLLFLKLHPHLVLVCCFFFCYGLLVCLSPACFCSEQGTFASAATGLGCSAGQVDGESDRAAGALFTNSGLFSRPGACSKPKNGGNSDKIVPHRKLNQKSVIM